MDETEREKLRKEIIRQNEEIMKYGEMMEETKKEIARIDKMLDQRRKEVCWIIPTIDGSLLRTRRYGLNQIRIKKFKQNKN